ncbi:EI24 domain-containing protein [Odoribacter sp. OttesenSCG-928-J03]|nr:EI24 domain-containing protein [Odoribacter sp. OttesenSCG-928-J03]
MIQDFFRGVGAYGKAIRILFTRQFIWFLIFPFLLTNALFWIGEYWVATFGADLSQYLEVRIEEWLKEIAWLQWLGKFVGLIIWLSFRIFYFITFVSLGGYVLLILMSPLYSWLSEYTEAYLTGTKYPFSMERLLREMIRGISLVIRNMFFQLLITFLIFLCSFIPFVGLFSPFLLFGVAAYFYGFSFVDYAIERRKLSVRESIRYINHNKALVVGIGSVFALAILIPWFNLIACGFVSVLSVIAGTIAINEKNEPKY